MLVFVFTSIFCLCFGMYSFAIWCTLGLALDSVSWYEVWRLISMREVRMLVFVFVFACTLLLSLQVLLALVSISW